MRDRERGLLLCDRLELHFLELSKIDGRKPVSALTEIERLGAYLKFASVEDRQDYVKLYLRLTKAHTVCKGFFASVLCCLRSP